MVHPGVLVDLTAQEHAAVGALFADDLGVLDLRRILDQQRAAFAHAVVLGLVEGIAAVVADRAERLSLVLAHHALRSVLNDLEVMALGDFEDSVHLAANAGIVNRNDRLGLVGDRVLDELFVDVHGVGTDVDKDDLGASEHERVGGGNKGERRHDHLVAGLDLEQERRHFQRMGAGGGQQRLGSAGFLLDPLVAVLGKLTVAADLLRLNSLLDVIHFGSQKRGYIKRYHVVPFLLYW